MLSKRRSLSSSKDPMNLNLNKGDFITNMDINGNLTEDLEISSTTIRTLEIMKICSKRIILPFNAMLTMVGWRSIDVQMYHSNCKQKFISIMNNLMLVLLILIILFSYSYQVLTCRFVMNPNDQISTDPSTLATPESNSTNNSWHNIITIKPNSQIVIKCNHLITTYIIPNIIHFMAYIIGIIHYRFRRNEDIYGLMEKALQYSTSLEQNKKSQYKVTTILTIWMILAVTWVVLSVINHVMYDISYATFSRPFFICGIPLPTDKINNNLSNFLFILDVLGYVIISTVTAAVLLNYTLYCELVKFYVSAINKKIEMRCIKLNVIKNDIHITGLTIDIINSTTGTMTTLIYIYIFNLFVGGMNMLLNKENVDIKLAFRSYFVIHLIPLVIIPLIQCARVNSSIKRFQEWAMLMSVFGYRKEKSKDLNSFLLYTMGFKSKAKLVCFAVEWPCLCILLIVTGFIFISCIQSGILSELRFVGNL